MVFSFLNTKDFLVFSRIRCMISYMKVECVALYKMHDSIHEGRICRIYTRCMISYMKVEYVVFIQDV